jgi:hypothetical protein
MVFEVRLFAWQRRSCHTMKKPMYLLFAVAALLLAGGRMPVHSVVWPTSHAASILQSSDDGPGFTNPDRKSR